MIRFVRILALSFSLHALFSTTIQQQTASSTRRGVVLLAHGGSAAWNSNVRAIAAEVNRETPTEVALGMASRASIQAAVENLERRGVTSIVAVPLFISSHSSVITSTEYLLGLRKDMPEALKVFAKMSHGADGTLTVARRCPLKTALALSPPAFLFA